MTKEHLSQGRVVEGARRRLEWPNIGHSSQDRWSSQGSVVGGG